MLGQRLFSTFAAGSATDADAGKAVGDGEEIAKAAGASFRESTDSAERIQIVLRALTARLARAMSMSADDIELGKPLSMYGVDSLMAVDLRNWIMRGFEAPIKVSDIMGGVSAASAADLVVARARGT